MKIVIVGAGEVGFHIASHLALENKDVVIVDTRQERLHRVSDQIDVQTVLGSGSSPVSLENAGVKEAEIILAVTNSDEINLVTCLAADILSPSTIKLARLRNTDFDDYYDKFRDIAPHINTVINPDVELVKTIFQLMSVPGAMEVGEFAAGQIKFIGVKLDESTRIAGAHLSEVAARIGKSGPLIAAIVRDEELIIPMGKDRLLAGDEIYFVCENNKLTEALSFFGKCVKPAKRVMIVGGGSTGSRLAGLLEKKSIQAKIIENNLERCNALADQLHKTMVIHGDGSDQRLLLEENIQDMDMAVMLTDNEETNIVASLLAKRMGARKVITKINRFSYFPLMKTIGIEKVVSPRLSAINTILKHIRRGMVLSVLMIKGEQAEVIEAVALETSAIVNRPLQNISLPKGVLITGIIRNDRAIIPSGKSIIHPNDRIIIFSKRKAIPALEKILAVKLEYF